MAGSSKDAQPQAGLPQVSWATHAPEPVVPAATETVHPSAAQPGNQAMQRLLRSNAIRAQLKVGRRDDPLEEEANQAADRALAAGPAEADQAAGAQLGGAPPMLRRQPRPSAGSPSPVLPGRGLPGGGGRPLDPPTRAWMEARLGGDFGEVSIHTGPHADAAATALGARAYTAGSHIVFGAGQYDPGTTEGQRLLAHELAHVMQQREGLAPAGTVQRGPMDSMIYQDERREAERQARLRREAEHRRWEASRRARVGGEIAGQSTTLAEERRRTEQSLLAQRGQLFTTVLAQQRLPDALRTMLGLAQVTLPEDLPVRWGAARQAVEVLRLGIQQHDIPIETQEENRALFAGYYLALLEFAQGVERAQAERGAQERQRYEERLRSWESQREMINSGPAGEPGERAFRGGWALANPRPEPPAPQPTPASPRLRLMLPRVREAASPIQWQGVLEDFDRSTRAMDDQLLWLLSPQSEARQNFEYFRALDERLARLEREHPLAVRIPAVFYPKDQFVDLPLPEGVHGPPQQVAKGIPWQFYLYHTGVTSHDQPARSGGEWILEDATSPREYKANRTSSSDLDAAMLQQGAAVDPPYELFEQLDSKLRFPEGQLHWRMPSGRDQTLETTASWSVSDWLRAIGIALAAVALIAGVIVTGGLAAPAAGPGLAALGTAAGLGAAGFNIAASVVEMEERRTQGMLTQGDVDRATLSIAVDIASALSLGLGRFVAAATQVGERAGLAARAAVAMGRYWFLVPRLAQVTTAAALAGDVIQVMTATADFIRAYRAIQNQPGLSDAEREGALAKLVATGLLTAGLSYMSIRSNVHGIRQGTNLHVVGIDAEGRIQVRPAGVEPGGPRAPGEPAGGARAGAGEAETPGTPRPGGGETPGAGRTAPTAGEPAPGWSRRGGAPEPPRVQENPDLTGGKVEIRTRRDESGRIVEAIVHHAPDARPRDIAIHERMAVAMERYGTEIGRIPALIYRLRLAFGGNPPPLSLQAELRKLRITAADYQNQLTRPGLSAARVRELENRLALVRREINQAEAAIADPALRSRYPTDVVALPTKPSGVPNLPDPPNGHHYELNPQSNRWELVPNAGYTGPRYHVEYDEGGNRTGFATNRAEVEQTVVGRPLDADTQGQLERLGYIVQSNGVIRRPPGHAEGNRPRLVPLEVEQGRVRIATGESTGEQQARLRAALDPQQTARLQTAEQGLAPRERLVLVEGLADTGVTWRQVLTGPRRAELRRVLRREGVAEPEIDRLIDGLVNRAGTIKVVLGTTPVREAFPSRQTFVQQQGQPAAGVEVHHGDPLYLGGGHRPELMFGLPEGPHAALHRFFEALTIPSGPLRGTALQPAIIQGRVRSQAQPAAGIIDTATGEVRYVPLVGSTATPAP